MELLFLAVPMLVGAIYLIASDCRLADPDGSPNPRVAELRLIIGLVLLIGGTWACVVAGVAATAATAASSFEFDFP